MVFVNTVFIAYQREASGLEQWLMDVDFLLIHVQRMAMLLNYNYRNITCLTLLFMTIYAGTRSVYFC